MRVCPQLYFIYSNFDQKKIEFEFHSFKIIIAMIITLSISLSIRFLLKRIEKKGIIGRNDDEKKQNFTIVFEQ